MTDLGVDDIARVLASGADVLVDGGGHSQLEHALQTAALLRASGDDELAVAGLVHDIGHLLPGVDDAAHAAAGADAVRAALGERVAELVGLHVAAKRYLVAVEGGYGGALAADSVASLALQGGPMTPDECAAFVVLPAAAAAIALRRADEGGKVLGLRVGGLDEWMVVARRVHELAVRNPLQA